MGNAMVYVNGVPRSGNLLTEKNLDIVIYNSDILKSDEEGLKFTGYFGNDWFLEKGDFIYNLNSEK